MESYDTYNSVFVSIMARIAIALCFILFIMVFVGLVTLGFIFEIFNKALRGKT